MKHISATGCGYSIAGGTYSCKGIGKLKQQFKQANSAFEKIPQHIEGFVMTLNPILDMSGGITSHLEVPELACRVELNPFVQGASVEATLNRGEEYTDYSNYNDGFLDMYRLGYDASEDIYFLIDGSTASFYDTYEFSDAAVMGPGILEPMVDTSFGPIGVHTITAVDAGLDGLGYSLDVFGQWRNLIETRINSLSRGVTVDYKPVNGLLNLEQAKNKEGHCSNFKISLIGGTPSIIGTRLRETPVYEIAGGTVFVNGTTVPVVGITAVDPVFDAYLDILESTVAAGEYVGVIRDDISGAPVVGHLKYVYIGSVVSVTGSSVFPYRDANPYTLYQIKQGNCIVNVDVADNLQKDYKGPFLVEQVSGNTMHVTGFDLSGTTVYAGQVFVDGGTGTLVPVKEGLTADGASGFVYAHVDLVNDATLGWIYNGCDYNLQPWQPPAEEGHKNYDFRLAAYYVEGGTVSVEQIHYGDLYIDITGSTSGPVTLNYEGPFRVVQDSTSTNGFGVYGIGGSTDEGKAGRIFYNGKEVAKPSNGPIEGATYLEPATSIFANITVDSSGTAATCTFTSTASTAAGVYNVRLANIKDATHANQIHFGDIYLYGGTNSSDYVGPFKVSMVEGQQNKVKVTGVETVDSIVKAGAIYLDGISTAAYYVNAVESLDLTNVGVFLHVFLKQSTSGTTYEVLGATIMSAQNVTTPPTGTEQTYSVRLASKEGSGVQQTHFGDVYIDMQPVTGTTASVGYDGPFQLLANGGMTCSVCPVETPAILGYYAINGGPPEPVTVKTINLGSASARVPVYLNVTVDGGTVSTTRNNASNCYSVWLGDYDVTVSGTSTVAVPKQMHYGNVQVDGRWS